MTTKSMDLARLLWVDLTVSAERIKAYDEFDRVFRLKRLDSDNIKKKSGDHFRPDAILFEFDYPDRASLSILRQTKAQSPSLPIIMLTEQHSESLAVWALRIRAWEYLVKPVINVQLEKLANQLICLRDMKRDNQRTRSPIQRDELIPNELRVGSVVAHTSAIRKAINFLESNLSGKICEKEISDLCGMSAGQFSRTFKKCVGRTFQDYLVQRRIEKAQALLSNPNAPICDIAFSVGFQDASYFTRIFRQRMGMSPRQYRESIRPQVYGTENFLYAGQPEF